ncbi:hypothetical protein DICVIV_07057 [Dictyocaulus viviparus]|uniref:Uncharacterized protein n=1 Tax=Dictyocaulus viviparus TaxID=29172 RepID=A0A0D8XQD9_DICVI|nr:hypothetical protein DICVIV_07057 [Dictyocaulus viviparus]
MIIDLCRESGEIATVMNEHRRPRSAYIAFPLDMNTILLLGIALQNMTIVQAEFCLEQRSLGLVL